MQFFPSERKRQCLDLFSMGSDIAAKTKQQKVMPDTKVKGCNFHLRQSLWRKIQELGFTQEFKKKSEVGQCLTYTCSL